MANYNLQDLSFGIGLGEKTAKLEDVLQIITTDKGRANNFKNGSTVLINSDRLILNSKTDYLMLCGKEGVMISSPKGIHLDCDNDIHIFSNTEVYIGLPNKGAEYNFESQKIPKTKAQATTNSKYEPLVLGLKLVNLLEDLLVVVKNATVITPSGQAFLSAETMYNLACLQSRLPEMLSTYAFIDGVTHEGPDPEPPLPSGVRPTTGGAPTGGSAGSTVSATQASSTTQAQSQANMAGGPQPDIQQQAAATSLASSGSAVPPVAANPNTSNPISTNSDGLPPTQSSPWVPGQLIVSGTESPDPQTNPPQTIPWEVRKSDSVNLYKGTYINNIGIEVVIILEDLQQVIEATRLGAKNEIS